MVPKRGLEPPRPLSHWHLKPARLPIPPPGPRPRSGEGGQIETARARVNGAGTTPHCAIAPRRLSPPRPSRGAKIQMQGLVTVFGGSGFIGKQVVRALAKRGLRVRVAVRRPNVAYEMPLMGDVGQIEL